MAYMILPRGPARWLYEMHPSLWLQVRYWKEEPFIKLLQPCTEVMLQHMQSEQMIGLNPSSFVSYVDIVVFVSVSKIQSLLRVLLEARMSDFPSSAAPRRLLCRT